MVIPPQLLLPLGLNFALHFSLLHQVSSKLDQNQKIQYIGVGYVSGQGGWDGLVLKNCVSQVVSNTKAPKEISALQLKETQNYIQAQFAPGYATDKQTLD